MKKTVNVLIVLLLVVILLVLTNPSEEDFLDWSMQQLEQESQSELEELLEGVIGRPVLQMATEKQDYLLFSIFTINKGGNSAVYIGFLRYIFIRIA
ncbi:MAG: hypothetical protein ACOCQW_02695 [Halanaerobiaceae bacterium]